MHFSNLISRRPKGISFLFYPPPSIPSKYPRAFFYPIPQVFFVVCAVESRRRHPTYFRLDFCSVESYSKKNQTFLNPHDFEYFSLYIYIVSQFFFCQNLFLHEEVCFFSIQTYIHMLAMIELLLTYMENILMKKGSIALFFVDEFAFHPK